MQSWKISVSVAVLLLLAFSLSTIWIFKLWEPRGSELRTPRVGDTYDSILVENRKRRYLLHVPLGYDGNGALPLVIVLHGGGGNAIGAANMTGFNGEADREGFIVVYPEGSGRFRDRLLTWNSGNCCGYALDNNVNDVGFIDSLITRLESEIKIDTSRVFVTGISNGGMMAYRLACELSAKIAGIAPVAGALNVDCNPSDHVSVIAFHGTADRHVLYGGGEPLLKLDPHNRVDRSVSYAISFWVKQDQCSTIANQTQLGNVIRETYANCSDGTDVMLYTIIGGGHAWPGGQKGSVIGDEPTQEISATHLIWEFFKQHPKQSVGAQTLGFAMSRLEIAITRIHAFIFRLLI